MARRKDQARARSDRAGERKAQCLPTGSDEDRDTAGSNRLFKAHPSVAEGLGRQVDEPTIAFAAKRSPATVGAVQDLVTEALVGVLNTDGESDQKARTCRARPFAPPARSDQRDRKREADVALLADQVVAA